jgi:8-oxo-dGTP pyrophosphatase MutT (NUDIX family)
MWNIDGAVTHAGAVVFRRSDSGDTEFLLVGARSPRREWVLPKGHIEPGESPEDCALRELREEAGIDGKVVGDLGEIAFDAGREAVRAKYFLVKFIAEGERTERRAITWLPYSEALATAAYDEAKQMLRSGRSVLDAIEHR